MSKINKKTDVLINGLILEDDEGCVTEIIGLKQMIRYRLPDCWGEIDLLLSIMESAILDRDTEYINSSQFAGRCKLLGLNTCKIRSIINSIWRQ